MSNSNITTKFQDSNFNPLEINLNAYSGPLDLLLDLIKSKKKSITEIPLAEICLPYLDYLKERLKFDLNIDCEFIEIASTLILIKSRALLPKPEEITDEDDPEVKLKEQLIQHEEWQKLGYILDSRDRLYRDFFTRPQIENTNLNKKLMHPKVIDFLAAYQEILERERINKPYEYSATSWDVEKKIAELRGLLMELDHISFLSLRVSLLPDVLGNLMAILELTRLKFIEIYQEKLFSDINCYATNNSNSPSNKTI